MQERTDPGELARIKRIQIQMRDAERAKFSGYDKDKELSDVWVAHVWVPNDPANVAIGEWVFAGFRPKRRRRKPQSMNQFFSKIRRKLGLEKTAPVLLTDLQSAAKLARSADQSWRVRPPQFQKRLKPKMDVKPGPRPMGKTTKRRAKKMAYKLNKKTTRFIALGRNPWDRKEGRYLYCGPLEALFRSDAVREADRLFRSHTDILVVKVSDLSKPLRNQMHSGKRIKAGVARIIWPEPVPEFDPLWEKLVKSKKAEPLESDQYFDVKTMWFDKDCPWLSLGWLRKAIKQLTPSRGEIECSTSKDSGSSLKTVRARKGKSKARHVESVTTNSSRTKSCVLPLKPSARKIRRRPAAMRARRRRAA